MKTTRDESKRIHPQRPGDRASDTPDGVAVHFLMFNVDAPDGVSRAVLTLANRSSSTGAGSATPRSPRRAT